MTMSKRKSGKHGPVSLPAPYSRNDLQVSGLKNLEVFTLHMRCACFASLSVICRLKPYSYFVQIYAPRFKLLHGGVALWRWLLGLSNKRDDRCPFKTDKAVIISLSWVVRRAMSYTMDACPQMACCTRS